MQQRQNGAALNGATDEVIPAEADVEAQTVQVMPVHVPPSEIRHCKYSVPKQQMMYIAKT